MAKSRKSAAEKVYGDLRDAITFSRLKPGERLLESKLCEGYKVSRTPLREAIRQLQAQGYITVEKNRGAIVKKTSIEEVEEIYSILALIETIGNLRNRLYRFRILMMTKGGVETFTPQHRDILDAIVKGDGKEANRCMMHHMLCAKENRVEFLKTYPELL